MNKQKGFISIGIIIFGVVLLLLAFVFIPPILKMAKLNNAADKRADILNSISFISGESTNAEGLVDGDLLTAKDDEKQSSIANAKIETDKTFGTLFDYANKNLSAAGYKIDETSAGTAYFQLSSGYGTYKNTTSSIVFRYLNVDYESGINIRYVFSTDITCPRDKACTLPGGKVESENLLDYKSLFNQKVIKLDITNAHISNDYMLRRGF